MLTKKQHRLPLIIGHRGAARDAPENTLESFHLAWEQGADGIEADFRLTGDGRIVAMHDATTVRTTGAALTIAASRLQDLQRLDAGSWKGPGWSGARIPTLEEVLAAMPQDGWFFIEIKSGPEIIPPLTRLLLASGHSPERIRLLAFSAPLLALLKQQLPDWRTCWLSNYRHNLLNNSWHPSRPEVLASLHHCGADGLASANRAILDEELVEMMRKGNKELHAWTVDRLPAAERLCALGIDAIMTNRPGWLRRQLESSPV